MIAVKIGHSICLLAAACFVMALYAYPLLSRDGKEELPPEPSASFPELDVMELTKAD